MKIKNYFSIFCFVFFFSIVLKLKLLKVNLFILGIVFAFMQREKIIIIYERTKRKADDRGKRRKNANRVIRINNCRQREIEIVSWAFKVLSIDVIK